MQRNEAETIDITDLSDMNRNDTNPNRNEYLMTGSHEVTGSSPVCSTKNTLLELL